MFKIEPVQDKTRQRELCQFFGAEFDEELFGYYMYDCDTLSPMGFSQFEIGATYGYIKDLLCAPGLSDYEAMFILGRQTMNFIDSCGDHTCYARIGGGDAQLLSAIGFKTERDGRLFVDMTGMFDGNCGNH